MSDLTGQVLGERYRVDSFLGRGGMADVYRVWDLQRAVPLALKSLHAEQAADPTFLANFQREAKTLSMLQHPNIVRCYGLGEAGGQAFLLMDFIDGLTLDKEILMHSQGMPVGRILEILRPVCAALFYAHRMGMVHCDIKPANIMIHRNGTVYLTDFGIARMREASADGPSTAGTPAYIAPEQVAGGDPAPTNDIYALGVVLFEMLTGGKRPFTGTTARVRGSTAKKIIWEKHHLPAPSPRKYNPAVSERFEAIVTRCLAADPARRYPTALDLLREVEAAAAVSAAAGTAGDELSTQADLSGIAREVLEDADRQNRWPRRLANRLPRRLVGAIGAGLLLAVLALTLLSRSGPNRAGRIPVVAGMATVTASETATTPTALTPITSELVGGPGSAPSAAAETQSAPTAQAQPSPTPLGSSRWVAFASDRNGELQIWIVDAANPDVRRQLTEIRGGACQPAWSPDGTRIAFTTPCKGPSVFHIGSTIQVVDVDTRMITDLGLPRNSFDPAWSADGRSILYSALAPSLPEIRAVDLETGAVTTLIRRGERSSQPSAARAGDAVAFLTTDQRRRDALWIMGRDGSSPEIVNESAQFSEPVFSPDGRRILASANSGDNRPYLALLDRSDPTAEVQRLFIADYTQHHGSFSPDGQWIVFWSELVHNGGGEILMVSLDGKQVVQLTKNDKRDIQPAWQPFKDP